MTKQITKPVAATKAVTKPVAAKSAAAKPVSAKVATPAKAVQKAAPAPAAVEAKAAPRTAMKEVVKSLHILTDIARPQSGPRLFAHTVAALNVLGMFGKGHPGVRRAALQAMIGSTAVAYHLKKKGTMVEQGERIALTEFGAGFFPSRTFDKAEREGFEKLFKTGDGSAVKVRKEHIVPVSLAL